jgi:peptidoglycan/LPS O-acetylase OafA/YrhL
MKLEKLEALRGLAAVYVVFHHAIPYHMEVGGFNVSFLFRFGQEAVILFFLLSGFVINYSFSRSRDKTFRNYFLKRFLRIYIPLIFVMFLSWVSECVRAGHISDLGAKSLLLNLLMLQDVGSHKPNVIVDPYLNNKPLWSLSYEWWFYMLYFPLKKYILTDRRRDIAVFGVAVISSLVYLYYPVFLPRLLMYMSIWWFGVTLSNAYMHGAPMNAKQFWVPLVSIGLISLINGLGVYLAMLSGTYKSVGFHPAMELRHHVFAILAVLFALFWRSQRWVLFKKTISPFLVFAPISYAIYISHHPFVVDASYLSFLDNKVIEFSGYFFVMLVFAYFLEKLVYPALRDYLLSLANKNRS